MLLPHLRHGSLQRLIDRIRQRERDAHTLFLAMVGHEMRTPLQTLMAIEELLQRKTNRQDGTPPLHLLLANTIAQLERQVADLSDYARLASGRLALHPTAFRAGALVQLVVETYRDKARAKKLALHTDIDMQSQETDIVTDAVRLQQIVGNLLANAIKYTPAGSVTLHLRHLATPPGVLEISVEDTGPGIGPQQLAALRRPYVRGDGLAPDIEGTGLGLAVVDQLVHLLQGTLTVDARPGRGSRFRVTLPSHYAAAPSSGKPR